MKIILLISFFYYTDCFAQNEYNHWIVSSYEINFCDSVSVDSSGLNLGSWEGFATICDKNTGQLLFSSDGWQVWNRNLQQMPNGNNLGGGISSAQGALIVQQPGSKNIFYLFTTDDVYPGSHGLEYSVIDLNKDGGLGDVTIKNMFLDSSVEKLNAVYNPANNSFWVISYNQFNNKFMSFLVDSNGLNTNPVLSISHVDILPESTQTEGYLKSSPNGQKIISVFEAPPIIGLYNFNKNSGLLSLQTFLQVQTKDGYAFGASFSPDNSKVYISAGGDTGGFYNNTEIYQFDVISNDTNIIKSSRITIDSIYTGRRFVGIQMGPDGKIYIARESFDSLSVINKPNLSGTVCQFMFNSILTAQNSMDCLSNNIDGLYYSADSGNNINLSYTAACNKTDSFTINTARGYSYFAVNFGDGTDTLLDSTQYTFKHRYDTAGTYTVKLHTASGCNIQDSVTISVAVDTAKCTGIASIERTRAIIPTIINTQSSQTKWHIINLPQGNNSVTIYNELGQIIYKSLNYLNDYDMRMLPSAMYFYRLTLESGEVYVGKVVVVR